MLQLALERPFLERCHGPSLMGGIMVMGMKTSQSTSYQKDWIIRMNKNSLFIGWGCPLCKQGTTIMVVRHSLVIPYDTG